MSEHGIWRLVDLDVTSNKPMWYMWPKECPMMAAKVADGHPARLACIDGVRDPVKGLGVFTTCWHTDKDAVREQDVSMATESVKVREVCCRYNENTDHWNRPMGKVDPTLYKPQQLGGPGDETLSAVMQRVLSGAPEGTLDVKDGHG